MYAKLFEHLVFTEKVLFKLGKLDRRGNLKIYRLLEHVKIKRKVRSIGKK